MRGRQVGDVKVFLLLCSSVEKLISFWSALRSSSPVAKLDTGYTVEVEPASKGSCQSASECGGAGIFGWSRSGETFLIFTLYSL